MTTTRPAPRPGGRRAVVVGGSSGIGRGIADAWAGSGMDVTVLSRREPTGPSGDRLRWCPADLTDPDAARDALAGATEGASAVCFAAVHYGERRAPICDVPEPEWRRQLAVNLEALWLTLTASLPHLRAARPGLLLGVSSEVVHNGGPDRSGYTATKSAAAALLESVALEEDPAQVRIVQVMPAGMVDTPGIRARRPDGYDYSGYMDPAGFADVALSMARRTDAEHHGDSIVVEPDGSWRSITAGGPASQSRARSA